MATTHTELLKIIDAIVDAGEASPGSVPVATFPNDTSIEWRRQWQVPEYFYSITSVKLLISRLYAGNLYLNIKATLIKTASATAPATSSTGFLPIASTGTDGKFVQLTIANTAFSSLTNIEDGDIIVFSVCRDATSATDTYEADLNLAGIVLVYQDTNPTPTGTHYCSQTDLERRISSLTLAQYTNDTAGATSADTDVLDTIFTNVDAIINAKAGQVYTVPFTVIPDIIKNIAISLSIYQVFQRRPVLAAMPPEWQVAYDAAMQQLDDISNMLLWLPDSATIISTESNIVTQTESPLIDFFDEDNEVSLF